MAVVKLAHNAVEARLIDADRPTLLFVQKLLSYQVQGADQMQAFKAGHWDGRSSFLELRTGRFPAGFVALVQSRLTKLGHHVQIVRKPFPEPLGPVDPIFDPYGYTDARYDYQRETVNRVLKHGRLTAQIATGGGKSRIAQMAVARIMRPTLFLTTRGVLMYQMRDHFQAMFRDMAKLHPGYEHLAKYNVGVLGDGVWEPRKLVNVGMVQTFAARLREPDPAWDQQSKLSQLEVRRKTMKLLEMFELVILEEAHESSGNSYYEILAHCTNAHYRLALTATPFMKDDEEANMRLVACAGIRGIQVTEKQLIDCGILATPYFKFMRPGQPKGLYRSTRWPRCYEMGVMNSVERNTMVIQEAIKGVALGLPVMILVSRKNHGANLLKTLQANGIPANYIFGDSDQATRSKTLKALASGDIKVLIGSTILDVGVDVPAIGMVIIASAGKAEVQYRQRIGRGLRAKKSGPNVAFIVDFVDSHNNILSKHSHERLTIIQDTPGFAERIVPYGEDFDYHGLGFA